jgi:hypothetical protein
MTRLPACLQPLVWPETSRGPTRLSQRSSRRFAQQQPQTESGSENLESGESGMRLSAVGFKEQRAVTRRSPSWTLIAARYRKNAVAICASRQRLHFRHACLFHVGDPSSSPALRLAVLSENKP